MVIKKSKNKRPFIIGLTGSIGMGKTTVANMFNQAGIPVSNADEDIAKSMDINGECVLKLSKLFPKTLRYDDKKKPYIDKSELAKVVFKDYSDLTVLDKLEKILHPVARKAREKFLKEMTKNGHNIVLYDIPLLFENNLEKKVDITICVSTSEDIQKQRVLSRPNMTEEKLKVFLERQISDAEKRKRSDIIIDTSKSLNDTKKEVQKIIKDIKQRTI